MERSPSLQRPGLATLLSAVSAAALLAACVAVPASAPHAASGPVELPATLIAQAPSQALDDTWWQGFGEPALDAQVDEALRANRDLRTAAARVREARAQAAVTGAALYPTLGATAGAQRGRQLDSPLGNAGSLGLTASWEPDVFGRRRGERDAALARADAAMEDARARVLVVSAEVVRRHFETRALAQRVQLLERHAALQQRILQMTQDRYGAGLNNAFDVQRTQASLDAARARIAPVQAALQASRNAQAVLLGRVAGDAPASPPPPLAAWTRPVIPLLPGSLPGTVLLHRPDVAAAQARLDAEAASLRAARAQAYPTFVLQFQGARWHVEPDAGPAATLNLFGLQIGATVPLFDAGRVRALVAMNDARRDGAAAQLEGSLLAAIAEVDTSHATLVRLLEQRDRLLEALSSAQAAADTANALYEAGTTALLDVLLAQAQALQQEDDLLQADAAAPVAYATLATALGGGALHGTGPRASAP